MIETSSLRRKLLDLAITGKLVPRTGEWKRVRFADVCSEFNVGIVIKPTRYYVKDGGLRAFRNANVKPDRIDDSDWALVSKDAVRENPRCVVHTGDILIARSGAPGIAAPVSKEYDGYAAIDVLIATPQSNVADARYLSYFINSPEQQQKISGMNRGVALSHIGVRTISELSVDLPPLVEQKAIVKRLEEFLELEHEIAADSTAVDELVAAAKQKILGLAFAGKLVPNRGKWRTVRLGDIAETTLGKMLNRRQQTGAASPYLCTINVRWGSVDLDHVKEMLFEPSELKQYDLRKGDLLVCEGGDVGRATVWDRDDSYPFQNSLHRVRFRSDNPWYVQRYLEYLGRAGKIAEMCSGVTIKHFTSTILKNLEIPLPPLAEQKAIVAKVDGFFSILNAMRDGKSQSL